MVKPNPECDHIWPWDLWEVLRSWGWSPYGWYWCSYERDPTELQPCEDTARRWLSIYQESESHSVGSDSATPWTVTHQPPLFMGFSRQEYWGGLPFPFPGDLPNPGMEPRSPALQADFFNTDPRRCNLHATNFLLFKKLENKLLYLGYFCSFVS